MRNESNLRIENYRKFHPTIGFSEPGANWGYFERGPLRILSSGTCENNPESKGWEHVSVSCAERCPTWEEMSKVKEMFWSDTETVIQFHPRKEADVNFHPYCLHLWKMANTEFLLPPKELLVPTLVRDKRKEESESKSEGENP